MEGITHINVENNHKPRKRSLKLPTKLYVHGLEVHHRRGIKEYQHEAFFESQNKAAHEDYSLLLLVFSFFHIFHPFDHLLKWLRLEYNKNSCNLIDI